MTFAFHLGEHGEILLFNLFFSFLGRGKREKGAQGGEESKVYHDLWIFLSKNKF